MPGKVIQGIKRAGTKNAILMLDEIDKLGQSFQGDPASALLEVLDPEQNYAFLDHYLDLPFDLSRVLFITTANTTSSIPSPLLDRMEVIELPGYTLEEKEDIAIRYVIPKELEANGLSPIQLKIERSALRKMMTDYAREPGLRSLQKLINRIARKSAKQLVSAEKPIEKAQTSKGVTRLPAIVVRESDLVSWLGPKIFYNEIAERIVFPVISLASINKISPPAAVHASPTTIPGNGNLKLTGQMGEVMTESATLAWSYVKKKISAENRRDRRFFKEHDIHLHIPAGAIPKDGPSAGITMATALYSLLSGRRAKHRLAMTGELSLMGKVLPVGGIKEKILAARRAGINTLILPQLNEKDLVEVPQYALKGMTIHYVNHVEEVFSLALAANTSALKTSIKVPRVLRKKTRGRISSSLAHLKE